MTSDSHLIVTIDYEVFGNGSGCVEHCVLGPAGRMMRIAERFHAPLTFFVEALEFMAMERVLNDRRVRSQVAHAVQVGHDAQLHLHPQWAGAARADDGTWVLEMRRWRMGDLGADLVVALVQQGKAWLEEVVNRSSYRCVAFRAGGWCIQPSEHILRVLQTAGFKVDSSVAPGLWNAAPSEWYDFRNVPTLPFWRVERDVCKSGQAGMVEVPIVTGKIGRMRHLHALKHGKSTDGGGLAPGCAGSYRGPDGLIGRILGRASKLARLGHVMLDLCTMPVDVLIDVTRQWLARHARHAAGPVPLVAIAHTKNFTSASESALEAYLGWARRAGLQFSTFGQWLEACGGAA